MKIFKIIAIMICALALTATISLAEDAESADAGGNLALDGTNVTGGATPFTFTPSPSSMLSISTDENTYALAGGSTKTTTDNGVEYGVISTASPIYQRDKDDNDVHVTPQTDDTTLTGTGWADKAGNELGS